MMLSDISIRHPVFAWMLMAALILFGYISYQRLGVSQMPDVDFPVVTVSVTYEGASPNIMETDVVDVLEESVLNVEGVRSISSTSRQESASISIEFDLERNIDLALQDVQSKIAQAQSRLPNEIDPPIVTKTNPEDQPILWISLFKKNANQSSDSKEKMHEMRELMKYARDKLKDQLQTINGVGEIILGGYIEPNLRVWVDPNKLIEYELTVLDIMDAINQGHVEIPAGRLETDKKEYNIRLLGEASTPEDFEKIPITRRGGRTIYKTILIGDVATAEAGLDEIRRISRTNGQPSIGLGIRKQRGSNAVAVAQDIRARIKSIQELLPEEYELQVNFDSTRFIEETQEEMQFTLILSAALTALVCWIFLGSIGSTFNIILAIPTSILGTFIFLYFFGYTLNTFTMLGLILAIGIVVDDAIMVLENIVRHQEMGKPRMQAAIDGAREITPAAIATTLALVAIFIPVVFMQGSIGKFFLQFGVTMSIAVSLSSVEALTLTPMRASRFLPEKSKKNAFTRMMDRSFSTIDNIYKSMLSFCLNHRFWVLVFSGVFFFASWSFYSGLNINIAGLNLKIDALKKEFVPPQDQSMFLVVAETPIGSSINFTDSKVREAETILAKHPDILRFFAAVGGFGGQDANKANMFITLKQPKERPKRAKLERSLGQYEIMDELREQLSKIKDFKVFMRDLSMRGLAANAGYPIDFTIRGPDWNQLTGDSESFVNKMRQSSYFQDVKSDYEAGQPEIQTIPEREAAQKRGVSIASIGQTIQAMIGGVRTGKFTESGRRNDIRIRLPQEERQESAALKKLMVRNNLGELIPLSEVTTIQEKDTLKTITRESRERAIGITANISKGYSQEEALAEVGRLEKDILQEGYHVVYEGSAKSFAESFQSLTFALLLGLIVAYMVLGSQYNSFLHPFIVLLALPFSFSGAWIALNITNNSLSLFSFIGLILLMGIAKKNSILLVDFTNQRRSEGLNVREAILTACPQRLRPILMTTFSTLAAAVPPALALGPGAETRIPMAAVIIGGVFISTFLTLFVIPCAYSLLSRFEKMPPSHT
ncbi:MAG: efflux RND transporter permease subunit [Deltaproteobacteria bacterium]|nr:efflux RND transporter permease subunit [Deltaproteobacteria bacterium]